MKEQTLVNSMSQLIKKAILFSLVILSVTFYGQTSYTFTPCGSTGQNGPSQSQANSTYSNTSLNGLVNVSSGIQTWTVPFTGTYRIEANGAKGGDAGASGGYGARMRGDFTLTAGQVLKILVGQSGQNGSYQGGGGGGSYVATSTNTALCVAGGGGGSYYPSYSYGSANMAGTVSTTGNSGIYGYYSMINALGGSSGSGGAVGTTNNYSQGSGGGGFTGNGANGYGTYGGTSFVNGGAGGAGLSNSTGAAGSGGFGGGGGSDWYGYAGGGGGGGYSGGGGGFYYGCGGGGGSYNSGSNTSNSSGVNNGTGYVIITILSGVNITQTASVTCNGLSTAALSAAGYGGTAPFTYSWSTGSTASSISGLGAGTYTCIATDAASITYSAAFTITQPSVLSSSITSQTNLTCNGASNGQLGVTAYGGTSPYTYSWSPSGGSSASATGLSAGTYISYVRDANNCLSAQIATITQPGPITILGFATNGTVCLGQTSILIGAGGLTYTWTNGVTNGVAFAPSATAVYTVTGTNASGCNGTATTAIVVNPLPSLNVSGPSYICTGSSTTLTVSGATTYTWSTASNNNSISISPLSTTSYTVSGTNSNGCDNTTVKTVTVLNTSPVVTANSTNTSVCIGNTTTLFGGGATTYNWSGGVTDNSPFAPGTSGSYTVTGFNACGSGTNSIFITVNNLPNITASVNNTAVCIGNTAILNGGGGVSYSWTGGVTNNNPFAPSSTSTYTVTGTDANGCQNTASKSIVVNPLPNIVSHVTNPIICSGNSTTLYGSGGVSYSWTGGVTDNSPFSPGSSGGYVVTGTDANGCQNTATASVTVIYVPAMTASASNPAICLGGSTSLSASGALSYTWSNGISNGSSFSPTITATYTVYGSNTCGTTSTPVSVTVNPLPNVTANASSSVACYGTPMTLYGGGASTYTWTGGITNNSPFLPNVTATYVVTGTDANGCQNSASKVLTVLPLPVVTASASSSAFCSGNSTTLYGGGASTYVWSGGVTDSSPFTPALTTAYTVTGTATNGCQNTAVKTITVYPRPTVFANVSNSVICNSNSTSFYGSGASTYTWSGSITNGAIIFPTVTTTYSVSGTNALTGCTSTNVAYATVSVNPLPSLTITASSMAVCAGQTVMLTASGANTYTWSNNIPNGTPFTPGSTTGYFVTGKNTLTGCSSIAYQTITVNPVPFVTANVSSTMICAGSSVIFTGGGANTYTWNGGVLDGVPFVPTNASYYVTGTNTLTGCVSTNYASQYVSINPAPNLIITISHSAVCQGFTTSVSSMGANTYSWSNGISENVPFTPSATTTYSVVGTNTTTGCTNTVTRTIVVNPLPVVSVSSTLAAVCIGNTVILSGAGATTYTWTGGISNGVPFTPSATTTYTVKGKNTQTGCTSTNTAFQTVTVNPLPIVSSSASSNLICTGSTVIFTGSGADTYTWTNGPTDGVPFTPTQADSYSVSGTNTLTGCTSTNISFQYVGLNPLPNLSVAASNTIICAGESSTLTVGSTASYTWSTGETTSTIAVSPSVTATYSATVRNSNNCYNTQAITIDVSDCTGLSLQSAQNTALLIYPNPSTGSFIIKGESIIALQIVNELGQVITSVSLNETNTHEISIQDFPAGIYFAVGQAGNKQIKQKIIIAK